MKAALITEEQISLVLCGLVPIFKKDQQTAIDLLQSLKPSEPSMVSSTSNKSFAMYTIEIPFVGEQP